ncbi:hypothetical protein F4694_002993 [Bacillus niacini]|uniref:Uncharacterized protein n=1 Tax=Neobacillus niacini TaxID=86668 RepID=A0A852TBQ7_9BACI|nr:hypothetical protein [Neobacillus niacini]NYE06213.1 hypothetical protein [Neobacillus niacini]
MTINHASTLKKEYFIFYINLVMISRNCTLEQAKEITLELFFHNEPFRYGSQSYERFLEAYHQLSISVEENRTCCA